MSAKKRPSAASAIYSAHLKGQFNNDQNASRTQDIEFFYQGLLTEIAVNRFKWEGLPEEVNVRFMELTLFSQALSVFYWDKRYDKYMALQGGGTNYLNAVADPVGYSVIGAAFTGINISAVRETEQAGVAVPIWANKMRMPHDLNAVRIWSHRLAELDRTIEINSANARQSKVLTLNENQKLTGVNINRQVDTGNNAIQVTGPMQDMAFVQALDLGINPDSLEKLDILQTRQFNKALGVLGINNANQDKTERLAKGEVDANNEITDMIRFNNLNERRVACKLMKKWYGLDVSVEYYTEDERKAAIKAAQDADNDNDDDAVTETTDPKVKELA